jgi:hypothetical protein
MSDNDTRMVAGYVAAVAHVTLNTPDGRTVHHDLVSLQLASTPRWMIEKGMVDDALVHYTIEPEQAERMANKVLAAVAQIRASG